MTKKATQEELDALEPTPGHPRSWNHAGRCGEAGCKARWNTYNRLKYQERVAAGAGAAVAHATEVAILRQRIRDLEATVAAYRNAARVRRAA